MRAKLKRGTAFILWLVIAGVVLAAAIAAVLVFRNSQGGNAALPNTPPTAETVSTSDDVFTIQSELESTSFDSIDQDIQNASTDLNSF